MLFSSASMSHDELAQLLPTGHAGPRLVEQQHPKDLPWLKPSCQSAPSKAPVCLRVGMVTASMAGTHWLRALSGDLGKPKHPCSPMERCVFHCCRFLSILQLFFFLQAMGLSLSSPQSLSQQNSYRLDFPQSRYARTGACRAQSCHGARPEEVAFIQTVPSTGQGAVCRG